MKRFALLLTRLATQPGSGPRLLGDDQGLKHLDGSITS